MLGLGIVLLVAAVATTICILYLVIEDTLDRWMVTMSLLFSILGTSIIWEELSKISSPTAIEVYQGKTTLEITYRDSIPVDSVVVYKNK